MIHLTNVSAGIMILVVIRAGGVRNVEKCYIAAIKRNKYMSNKINKNYNPEDDSSAQNILRAFTDLIKDAENFLAGPEERKYREYIKREKENGLQSIHYAFNREAIFAELNRMNEAPDVPDPEVLGRFHENEHSR